MRAVAVTLCLVTLAACDSGSEPRRDVSSTRVVMRPHAPLPDGAVARGAKASAEALAAPGPPVTPALLTRGRDSFAAFCSPCHGAKGHGDGAVVSRGFPAPPSYHQERLRRVSPEHIVTVIGNGIGRMYAYGDRVPPEDRWAVAHHVKALQADELRPGSSP
jgi:mono/diheme cytochrome c family protein